MSDSLSLTSLSGVIAKIARALADIRRKTRIYNISAMSKHTVNAPWGENNWPNIVRISSIKNAQLNQIHQCHVLFHLIPKQFPKKLE